MPAPYSDNLYSGLNEDNGDEELDALSPSDGYFRTSPSSLRHQQPEYSGVPSVPNVLVEDPTLREQDPAGKAREAAEERRLNDQMDNLQPQLSPAATQQESSSSSYGPSQARQHHRRAVEDDSSLSHPHSHGDPSSSPFPRPLSTTLHGDAPPAYSPRSPESPPSPGPVGTGYQTFGMSSAAPGSMNTPEETQNLLPREPESMGGQPPQDEPPRPSRWRQVRDSWRYGGIRRMVKTILGTLLLASIILMLLNSFMDRSDGKNKHSDVVDDDPIRKPGKSHEAFKWKELGRCYNEPHHWPITTTLVDFNPEKSLTIIQEMSDGKQPYPGRQPSIIGNLIIRPALNKDLSSKLVIETITNDADLQIQTDIQQEDQIFKIITPRKVEWSLAHRSPCIQIRATLYIPPDSVLEDLKADLVHMDIDLIDGLDLSLNNRALLSTVSGSICAPGHHVEADESALAYKLGSREIIVHTVSGDITGWYPLYDRLEMLTKSGTIGTSVTIKPADEKTPKQAVLDVRSVSGDITVKEILDQTSKSSSSGGFPQRDCAVKMETVSGTTSAYVIIGSSSWFESETGDLDLTLQPVLDPRLLSGADGDGKKIQLDTSTKSGTTKLELQEVIWTQIPSVMENMAPTLKASNDDAVANKLNPLGILKSSHHSISGDHTISYPYSWTGHLRAATTTGSQDAQGDGLDVIRRSDKLPKVLEGWKGEGKSEVQLNSVSGSEGFEVRSQGD